MQVIAFDLNTGLTKWKYTPNVPSIVKLPRATSSHGMTYENGIIYAFTGGAGTIVALDVKTGKIKWEHKTEFPTWCSPLVTNGLVFAGYVTSMGVRYNYSSDFGSPTETPQISSGILMALDADTGKVPK